MIFLWYLIGCFLFGIFIDFIKTFKKNCYHEIDIKTDIEYYKKTIVVDMRTFSERLNTIENHVKKGSLLDVGCSIGTFMEVAKRKDWDVFGVDLNKDAIRDCRKKGLKVELKDINLYKNNKKFDLINMSDLIEHVISPTKTLQKCRELLKDEGFIFISTPDFGSILARIMKERWFHVWPKEHLYYFNKKTMRKLLEKTGYEIVFIKNSQRYRDVNALVRHVTLLKPFKPVIRKLLRRGMKLYLNDELVVLAKPL